MAQEACGSQREKRWILLLNSSGAGVQVHTDGMGLGSATSEGLVSTGKGKNGMTGGMPTRWHEEAVEVRAYQTPCTAVRAHWENR